MVLEVLLVVPNLLLTLGEPSDSFFCSLSSRQTTSSMYTVKRPSWYASMRSCLSMFEVSIILQAFSLEIALCTSLLLKFENVQSHHSFWIALFACFTGSFCRSGFLITFRTQSYRL